MVTGCWFRTTRRMRGRASEDSGVNLNDLNSTLIDWIWLLTACFSQIDVSWIHVDPHLRPLRICTPEHSARSWGHWTCLRPHLVQWLSSRYTEDRLNFGSPTSSNSLPSAVVGVELQRADGSKNQKIQKLGDLCRLVYVIWDGSSPRMWWRHLQGQVAPIHFGFGGSGYNMLQWPARTAIRSSSSDSESEIKMDWIWFNAVCMMFFEAVNQQQQQCYSKAEEERARGFSGGSGKAEGISWRQLCQPTCSSSHLFFRVVSGWHGDVS